MHVRFGAERDSVLKTVVIEFQQPGRSSRGGFVVLLNLLFCVNADALLAVTQEYLVVCERRGRPDYLATKRDVGGV